MTAKPIAHLVCGGIFTPDPDVPAAFSIVRGVRIERRVCRCGLVGQPGDTHHTAPAPVEDVRQLAAGDTGGEG